MKKCKLLRRNYDNWRSFKLIELGESDRLTWGNLVDMYGSSAQDELMKLITLELIEKPELKQPMFPHHSPMYDRVEWDAYYNTKIVWRSKDKVK